MIRAQAEGVIYLGCAFLSFDLGVKRKHSLHCLDHLLHLLHFLLVFRSDLLLLVLELLALVGELVDLFGLPLVPVLLCA